VALWGLGLAWVSARAQEPTLYFGVLNQRSIALTAQYWNPILQYVSRQSGVPLQLKMGKTAPETTAMTLRGEFAFVYTNHLFTPERVRLGYQVIARPRTPGVRAQIVVRDDSPWQRLADLNGHTVVFPSREAFLGYSVPMDALHKAQIEVTPAFAGNQEGAIGQLQAKAVDAAAVNAQIMENYARRESFRYRVLWNSEPYLDLPIMANPAVPKAKIEAVRQALVGMAGDPEGRRILEAGAALLKLSGEPGFIVADDGDYANYREFYRQAALVKRK
jgi:phosphonate transport system substrate-binding protein